MFLIPKEKPVVEKLNSYYLQLQKMFEHYQGELGCGATHFRSPFAEGIIFFDKDDLLNGIYRDGTVVLKGKQAVDTILEAVNDYNFNIDIYQINPSCIYFWASTPEAKELYKDLTSEFTNLEGLIEKMKAEELTGFINVSLKNGTSGGLIFFNGGRIVGGSYSWDTEENQQEALQVLIEKSRQEGGIFHVSKIVPGAKASQSTVETAKKRCSWHVLAALEALLVIFEETVKGRKNLRRDFRTLLKKKFLEKADKYNFLDPFAGEFEYSNKKITFLGEAGDEEVAKGVVESVKELAAELGLKEELSRSLDSWKEQYGRTLSRFNISL